MKYLIKKFSTTLDGFDYLSVTDRTYSDKGMAHRLMKVISVARETDLFEIPPCAFHFCSQIPLDETLDGTHGHLANEDIIIMLKGRQRLISL